MKMYQVGKPLSTTTRVSERISANPGAKFSDAYIATETGTSRGAQKRNGKSTADKLRKDYFEVLTLIFKAV
jgi:hypothetical protein